VNVGDNIKRLRKMRGLTQADLGRKLGITQSAIGQFEKGSSSLKLETIEKIANALDIPVNALLMGTQIDYNALSGSRSIIAKNIAKRLAIIKFLDCIYDSASITKVKIYDKNTNSENFNDEYVNIVDGNSSIAIDENTVNCLLDIFQNICKNLISINALSEIEYINEYYDSPNILLDYCIEKLEIKSHIESKWKNESSKNWEQYNITLKKEIETNSNREEFQP